MKLFTLLLLLISLASQTVFAAFDTETDANDVILAGYDAVAYQTEGKPVKGEPQYTAVHNGAIYQFSSAQNRDTFQSNPTKYAPVYGGYCAYGMTFGKKFAVDGKAFKVVDGKLYVNKNREVYDTWAKEIPGNIKKADSQWPKVKYANPAEL